MLVVCITAVRAPPALAPVLDGEAKKAVLPGLCCAHSDDVLADGRELDPVEDRRFLVVEIQDRKGAVVSLVSVAANRVVPLAH